MSNPIMVINLGVGTALLTTGFLEMDPLTAIGGGFLLLIAGIIAAEVEG